MESFSMSYCDHLIIIILSVCIIYILLPYNSHHEKKLLFSAIIKIEKFI